MTTAPEKGFGYDSCYINHHVKERNETHVLSDLKHLN